MRENEEYDDVFYDDEEVDWNHLCFYPNKCGFIEATEEPLNCSVDLKDNCVNNGNLIYCIKDTCSENTLNRINQNHETIHYVNTRYVD